MNIYTRCKRAKLSIQLLLCVLLLVIGLSVLGTELVTAHVYASSHPRIPSPGQNYLVYGRAYHLQNGYAGFNGGYLDTRNAGCSGNYLCVSTASGTDRDSGSGSWVILSATGKAVGQPVQFNDQVYLLNQYQNNGGYLDTRNMGCSGNYLCVSTASSPHRDSNSGTWKIIPDSGAGPNVSLYQTVRLVNGYSNFTGGFLDTRNPGCDGNYLCVSTTVGYNRDSGSTTWRFIPR